MNIFRDYILESKELLINEGSEDQVFGFMKKIISDYKFSYCEIEDFELSRHQQVYGGGWAVDVSVDKDNKNAQKELKKFKKFMDKTYSWAGPVNDTSISIRAWWGHAK